MSSSSINDFPPDSLPSRLRDHRPPALHPDMKGTAGQTRPVTQATVDVFERAGRIQDDQTDGVGGVKFDHSPDILSRLSQVLSEAWSTQPRTMSDETWTTLISIHKNLHKWIRTRGEVYSLSGTFDHQLLGMVNYFLDDDDRPRNFRDIYYEREDGQSNRASWDKGKKQGDVEPDNVVIRLLADYLDEVIVVMEKKTPKVLLTAKVIRIVRAAITDGGFTIRVVAGSLVVTGTDIDEEAIHYIGQLVHYMDFHNSPIGVLTNYDAYILLVRIAIDRFTISDVVYRDYAQTFSQAHSSSSAGHYHSDMQVLELLLALCLYPLQDAIKLEATIFVKERQVVVGVLPSKKWKKDKTKDTGRRKNKKRKTEGDGMDSEAQEEAEEEEEAVKTEEAEEGSWERARSRQDGDSEDSPRSGKLVTPTSVTFPNLTSIGFNPFDRLRIHIPERLGPDLSGLGHGMLRSDVSYGDKDRTSLSSLRVAEITLDKPIGRGRIFTAYTAHYDSPIHTQTLVAKIANLDGDGLYHPDVKSSQQVTPAEVLACARHEARILAGPLNDLQGTVVPLFLGLYVGPRWVLSLQSYAPGHRPASYDERIRCQRAYEQIHLRGVIHRDVAIRHVLASPSTAMIIDFDRAKIDVEKQWIDYENRQVAMLWEDTVNDGESYQDTALLDI